MEHIEKSVDVVAPLSMVYNQWTQFEEFPEFMEGVLEVRQLDDKRLHWRATIAGRAHCLAKHFGRHEHWSGVVSIVGSEQNTGLPEDQLRSGRCRREYRR